MVKVESYIKVGDEFVPVSEFEGPVPDPQYIEGAIELEMNSVKILTLELWDDINWLWPYIVECLEELATKQKASIHFPDQPIELSFQTDARRKRVTVEVYIPQSQFSGDPARRLSASAPYNEFMTAMNEAGQHFFRRMIEAVPENRTPDESELRRLETLALDIARR